MQPGPRSFPILLLLFILSLWGNTQTLPTKISTYGPEKYEAGHPQVFSTEPLSAGRRAFGTVGKVFIHNGETFDHIPIGVDKAPFSMDRDRSGRLFVAGNSLMGVITPDSTGTLNFRSLRPLLPDSLLGYGPFWDTYCDGEGGVYFDAYERIFYYKEDTVEVLRPRTIFYKMHRLSDRIVVEDNDTGLFELSGSQKEYLSGSATLAKGKGIKAILPAAKRDSGTWAVFTESHGLFHYDPSEGKTTRFGPVEGEKAYRKLGEAKVNTATRLDPDENPYGAAYAVATELNGIYLLASDGEILIHLGAEAGLPDDYIWQVGSDRSGNMWATTNNGIALIHTGLPFTMVEKGSLFKGGVVGISRGRTPEKLDNLGPHSLFIATLQGAWVWQKEDGDFSLIEGTKIPCFDLYAYLSPEGNSRLLIGASDEGLLSTSVFPQGQKSPSRAKQINDGHTLALTGIKTHQGPGVLQGGRGNLHVLIPSKRGPERWETLLSVEKLPDEIHSIGVAEKKENPDSLRVWAGSRSKGLLSVTTDKAFSGYHITRYDTTDGLPKGTIDIFRDPSKEGGVLFGTRKGLYRFKEGSFLPCCRYGRIFCDSSRQVSDLKGGLGGEVWIDDAVGSYLHHLIPEDKGYRIDSTIFRALEVGTLRAIFPEGDRTWLGGDRGLACYYPDVAVDPHRKWHCRLRKVRGSGDSLLFGGTFSKRVSSEPIAVGSTTVDRVPVNEQPDKMIPRLPFSKNRMEFTFAAAFPTQQKAVTYSHKLVGFDTAWSKWGKEANKEYTSLPEGTYTFRVKARNIYLEESTTAAYRFRILSPWYRSWGAYGGYTLAGIGLIWLIVWLNSRRLLAHKEKLEKIVNERTKEIREQKEKVEEQQKETERQKEKVEEAHQEITQSIDYAQKIQYALLRSEEQVSPHIPEHFILFKPRSQVSGDFYWSKEHKGYFYLAAVDCTGHGVPGAFMSMLGICQLNEIMNTEELLTPAYILTSLRHRVVGELTSADPENSARDGMDAALVRIPLGKEQGVRSKEGESEKGKASYERGHTKGEGFNPHPKEGDKNEHQSEGFNPRRQEGENDIEVQFAGAQNPLYVIRKGIGEDPPEVEGGEVKPFRKTPDGMEVKGDPMPVGYDEHASRDFSTVSLWLRKGDMLYIFSDGYADQFGGPNAKKFRYGPFKQLLASIYHNPLEEQKRALDKSFEDWRDESQQEQIDDVVVIGVSL